MSGDLDGVLRLPGSAVPDGCRPWEGGTARRWLEALPPRWVPVRARPSVAGVGLPAAAVAGAAGLAACAGTPGWAAALVALHLVWPAMRPEAALLLAPPAGLVVLGAGDGPWTVRLGLVAGLVAVWAAVAVRLSARGAQRAAALGAAGGVTSALPGMPRPPRRGAFLLWSGAAVVLVGGVLGATAGSWAGEGWRRAAVAAAWCVVGLGLTVVLSAGLGRRRTAGLRRAPVPVLRVLVREDADGDTEVFAADDLAALRPLFTVATSETRTDDDDDDDDDEELQELLARVADSRVGPVREAVLYGVPHDGAEAVLLAAAERDGEPPVVEASVGPVRPVTGPAARRRAAAEKRSAARDARDARSRRAAGAAVAGRSGRGAPAEVIRWRAGRADWFAAVLVVLYGALILDASGWRRYAAGVLVTAAATLDLPHRLAWRVTADRAGLWITGFRRTRLLAWDDIRDVRCEGPALKVSGARASTVQLRVYAPRWRLLERRLGWTHPHERMAAELTALWKDPALRPAGTVDERRRGQALWPLGTALGAVCAAWVIFRA
ncbi:hypothetical protein [Streptomyces sp. NPDC088812]|uniref:hypothetical protein n=1 Tax=Streptomyces sp. NPDC088812 TaxID=3365905 RepID=UPI00380A3BCA